MGGILHPVGRRRAGRALFASLLAAGLLVGAARAASITSAGPLTNIDVNTFLNCAVNHTGDASGEFFGNTACGTLVAAGGTLYGPLSIPAGGAASPRTTFTPVSQTGPMGSGTAADPYKIVTVVDLGTGGLHITETDSYVVGEESYRTDVQVSNTSGSAQGIILYRAGDCFLQNSDFGFGLVEVATGAIACRAADQGQPGTRIEQWFPLTPGSSYMEANFNQIWAQIGSQQPFPNTCRCNELIDNGAGLSWSATIGAGASATFSHLTTFSPLGHAPLSMAKTATSATSLAGANNGYTITISNPNSTAVVVDSITDTLPAGFSYRTGTTSGLTTSDPTVNGQMLTWSGSFSIPANGTGTLSFGVVVSSVPGTYLNEASGTASGFTVAPTGPTAPITVTAAQADLALTKSDAPDPVQVGQMFTYTIGVHNNGPDAADAVTVSDTLPAGVTLGTVTPSQGSCSGTATISCALGTLANGADATVTIAVTPTVANPALANTATVTTSTNDPDTANNNATATTAVQPANQPPTCATVTATPRVLWPPNHRLVLVTLSGATDPDGDPVTLTITSVTQDEPVANPFAPDAMLGSSSNTVWLRSERDGSGDGRVYRIAFTASDGRGGTCTGMVTVGVPHDQSSDEAIDSLAVYDSFTGVRQLLAV
jgi:uncharacterized repeat protein (TIGR01451 family)